MEEWGVDPPGWEPDPKAPWWVAAMAILASVLFVLELVREVVR